MNITSLMYDLFRYHGLDWVWFGASILAVYLLGIRNKWGFVSMIVSDLTGLGMAYLTHSGATLIGSLIYLVLNVRGWYAWRADEKSVRADAFPSRTKKVEPITKMGRFASGAESDDPDKAIV